MPTEMHIASLVVHALPRLLDVVAAAIVLIPLARVHGTAPSGKLVVTLEGSSAGAILDHIGLIQQLRGVINVALVYQHAEANGDTDAPADADMNTATLDAPGASGIQELSHEHTT